MGHTDHWMLKLGVLIWSHSVATYSHPQLEGFYRPLPTISIIDMLAFHFPTCEYFQKTRLPAELEKSSWKWRLTVELNNEAKKLLLNLSNSILIKANLEWINLLREAFFFFFSRSLQAKQRMLRNTKLELIGLVSFAYGGCYSSSPIIWQIGTLLAISLA